jgi:hypothetical protein
MELSMPFAGGGWCDSFVLPVGQPLNEQMNEV